MQANRTESYTLVLNREETILLASGLGHTSVVNRIEAGMTKEQALFMQELYYVLSNIIIESN